MNIRYRIAHSCRTDNIVVRGVIGAVIIIHNKLIERDNDTANLTVALEQLILDQDKLQELTANAKESIRPYSEEKYYQRWNNLITATVESKNG